MKLLKYTIYSSLFLYICIGVFDIAQAAPTVTTSAASGVNATYATANGSLDNLGGETITQSGFVWSSAETSPMLIPSAAAHWKMNDNAANTDVADSEGTYTGTAPGNTSGLTDTGQINTSLKFNGASTDFISVPSSLSTAVNGNNLSISAWVYSNALGEASSYRGIVSEVYGSGADWNVQFELYLDGANHNLSAGFYTDWTWYTKSETDAFPLQEWVHVAATYDGHYIRIYRNGQQVAISNDVNKNLPAGTTGWRIGRRHDTGNAAEMWKGRIDDLRIYKKTLSQNEILNIYNSGNGTESIGCISNQLGARSGTGSFSSTLAGLTPNSTYYYQAYVINSSDVTTYGGVQNFNTSNSGYVTWDGSDSTAWSLGANWSGNSPPTSTDEVIINGSYSNAPTLDLSGGSVTIEALSLGQSSTSALTISNGVMDTKKFIISNAASIGANGTLTHTANTTTGAGQVHSIHMEAADLVIETGGKIDVTGKGFQYSEGTGEGIDSLAYDGAGGASYGGEGGEGVRAGSTVAYGSIDEPSDLGSGGGDSWGASNGGAGGGAVKLVVSGALQANGNIISNGADESSNGWGGGGSGGSIWIDTGTLCGSGTFSVNGGSGGENSAGGGGGGRIAATYATDVSNLTFTAYGGLHQASNYTENVARMGMAGTIFKKADADSYGDLTVDNNNYEKLNDSLYVGQTPINEAISLDTITIQNYGNLEIGNSADIAYNTLDWSNEGIITDFGGTFALLSGGGTLTVPSTARLYEYYERTFSGYAIDGYLETRYPLNASGDIDIGSTGTLTHEYNSTVEVYKLDVTAANLTIDASGKIDVSSRGYQALNGPGSGTSSGSGASGASYGGQGGDGAGVSATGSTYGSITNPDNLGSGGGNGYNGGSNYGGGAVKLTISGDLTINGNITANGGDCGGNGGSGGSGGSIWIDAGTLYGSGATISANGGTGDSGVAGGSGGGRIAVYYTSDSSSNSYQTYGGASSARFGGAGTIYKIVDGDSFGDLTISNNNLDSLDDSYTGKTSIDQAITFDAITINNYGNLKIGPSANIAYSSLDWSTKGTITDFGGTFALLSGGGTITIPATARFYEYYSRSFTGYAVNGYMETRFPLNASGDVNIGTSGILTHEFNTNQEMYDLTVTAANLTISSGGKIDVTARGYMRSEGPGAGTDGRYYTEGAGGGAYGGEGGDGRDSVAIGGAPYGSIKEPSSLGSGGGNTPNGPPGGWGGTGGGKIKLNITNDLTVNSSASILADGQNTGSYSGGGSGGAIWINATTLYGSGTISADGGPHSNDATATGGGGRIAVYYTTDSSTLAYSCHGGANGNNSRMGGAGTIYKKTPGQSNGDLIIDNNSQNPASDLSIGRTPLNQAVTFDTITLQNYGNLDINPSTNVNYTTLNWSTNGIITDSGGVMALLANGSSPTIPSGGTLVGNINRRFNNLTVNGTLTHSNNFNAETYKLNYTIQGNLTVGGGGAINVNLKGYGSSEGTGQGSDCWSSGGASYGGRGGNGSCSAGSTYGSSSQPDNIGSGAGLNGGNPGGVGGGAVKMTVAGDIDISGSITSNGGTPTIDTGGGSGGSIWIIGKNLSGSGSITANGGNATNGSVGGAGGGGRIAIYNSGVNTSNLSISAAGGGTGVRIGQEGTIYFNGEFVSVIDPGSGAGTDYTSLNSWQNNIHSDLTVPSTRVFDHSGITGSISDGDTVTGATSAFKGTVVHTTSSKMMVKNIRKPLTGTLTFTNSSSAVTGSGTTFTTQVAVNDYIWLDADSVWAQISAVTDNTHITLSGNYSGTGGSGAGSVRKSSFTKGEQVYKTQDTHYVVASDTGYSPIAVAKCRTTNGSADSTAVTIDSWGTSATNYVKIWTDPTENYRHQGRWEDSKYRMEVSGSTALGIYDEYVTVDGLQIKLTASDTSSTYGIKVAPDVSTNEIKITQNIIKGVISGTSSGNAGIIANTTQSATKIDNNVIYDFVNSTNEESAIKIAVAGNHYLTYNTEDNCYNGYYQTAGTVIARNNIAQDSNDGYNGTFDGTSGYNISDLANDASGTGSKNEAVVNFVDKTNDDFRLANADTTAKNSGLNLNADANAPVSTDIKNQSRTGTPDIGAEEGSINRLKGATRLKGGVRLK